MNVEDVITGLNNLSKFVKVNSPNQIALDKAISILKDKDNMDKNLYNYLFEFWKINAYNICRYCSNDVECKGKECDKYEDYDKVGTLMYEDGTEKELSFKYSNTCMDLDVGSCPLLINTPCHNCIENNMIGFSWNGVIPDNYETF